VHVRPLVVVQKVAAWACGLSASLVATFLLTKGLQPSGDAVLPGLIAACVISGLTWFLVPARLRKAEQGAQPVTLAEPPSIPVGMKGEVEKPADQVGFHLSPGAAPSWTGPAPPWKSQTQASKAAPDVARRAGVLRRLDGFHEFGERLGDRSARFVVGLFG
jgi:hypothetical protein